MTNFFYSLFFLVLSAAEKAAQSSGGFNWRDVTSLAGIVIPLLLGAFFYLLRKKQEAENELRKQQIQEIKESIKRVQYDADEALKKINETISEHLRHQTTCGVTYVSRDTYRQDMETQSSHVASMKGTIDTLNQIMVQQQTLVTQLVKSLS
jgi:hypothetical protein